MTSEVTPTEAAKRLKKLSFIKIDLAAFLLITRRGTEDAAEAKYGDSLYLPNPESLVAELSYVASFLQFRLKKKDDSKLDVNDPLFGRKVAAEISGMAADELKLNTAQVAAGVYLVTVEAGGESTTQRVVVE